MLVAHDIVDVLRHSQWMTGPVALSDEQQAGETRYTRRLADAIEKAEKFSFGKLDWFLDGEHGEQWRDPGLTADEAEAVSLGLIPLPAPLCWYEFEENPRIGLLIERRQNYTWVHPVIRERDGGVSTGPVSRTDWSEVRHDSYPVEIVQPEHRPDELFDKPSRADCLPAQYAILLTLMLSSKTTEITRADVGKSNRLRRLRGLAPLPPHRIVRIVPERYIRAAAQGGTHRSPRLHWRRSHLRHLPDGRAVIVVRHLVGLASREGISHDYVLAHG